MEIHDPLGLWKYTIFGTGGWVTNPHFPVLEVRLARELFARVREGYMEKRAKSAASAATLPTSCVQGGICENPN